MPERPVAVGLLVALLATIIFQFLSLDTIFTAIPLHVRNAGGSDFLIGLISLGGALVAMLARPFLVRAGNRWGQWAVMFASVGVMAITAPLYLPGLNDVRWIGTIRALHAIPVSGWILAGTTLLVSTTPLHRRGTVLGLWGAAGAASLVLGPAAGIEIYTRFGFQSVVWVGFACAALGGITLLAARMADRPELVETVGLPKKVVVGEPGASGGWTAVLGTVSGPVWVSITANLIVTGGFSAIAHFLPIYAVRNTVNPSVAFLCLAIAAVTSRLAGGRLSDRFGRRAVIVPSCMILIIGLVTIAFPMVPLQVLVGSALVGLGSAAGQTALLAQALDYTPVAERARLIAIFYTAQDFGHAGGGVVAGLLAGYFSYSIAFAAWGLIVAGALLLVLTKSRAPIGPRRLDSLPS